ncbi:hypothetical protein BJ165DRAFT_1495631 [Panaeolus papilionaceus]|nr:hypothetical protein BJ165DRAFT_1495631 [Panaeolus papilionaceus]
MWIDKVCHGLLHSLAKHSDFYLAAFIVTLVFHVPWLYFVCISLQVNSRAFVYAVL